MTPETEAFKRGLDCSGYPPGFLEAYRTIKCLAQNSNGETLIVQGVADGEWYIAKLTPEAAGSEGEILERLSHPALPRLISRFEADGVCAVVREYVDG